MELDKKSVHFLHRLKSHYQMLPSKQEELEIIDHLLAKVDGSEKSSISRDPLETTEDEGI